MAGTRLSGPLPSRSAEGCPTAVALVAELSRGRWNSASPVWGEDAKSFPFNARRLESQMHYVVRSLRLEVVMIRTLQILALGTALLLTGATAAWAQHGTRGGSGRSYSGGGGYSTGGRGYSSGGGYAGRAYAGAGYSYRGASGYYGGRGYSAGNRGYAYAGGRGYGEGRFYAGRGYYYGGRFWARPYYGYGVGVPFGWGYNSGAGCGYYDGWGYWHPAPCYVQPVQPYAYFGYGR